MFMVDPLVWPGNPDQFTPSIFGSDRAARARRTKRCRGTATEVAVQRAARRS
jgi:hypothetical protein